MPRRSNRERMTAARGGHGGPTTLSAPAPTLPLFRITEPDPQAQMLAEDDIPRGARRSTRTQARSQDFDEEPMDLDTGTGMGSLLRPGISSSVEQMNIGGSPSSMVAEHSDEENQAERARRRVVPVKSDQGSFPARRFPGKGKGHGKGRSNEIRHNRNAATDGIDLNSGGGTAIVTSPRRKAASGVGLVESSDEDDDDDDEDEEAEAGGNTNSRGQTSEAGSRAGGGSKKKKKKKMGELDESERVPLDKLVDKTLMYMLIMQHRKNPVKKADIIKNAMSGQAKDFAKVLAQLSTVFEDVFGMKMVGVGETQKSGLHSTYILLSSYNLSVADMVTPRDDEVDCRRSILFLILTVIFMLNRSIDEEMIWKILHDMKFHDLVCKKRENLKAFLKKEYVQTAYLTLEELTDTDPPVVRYSWGDRAEKEFSKYSILKFVAKQFPGKKPFEFTAQFGIAKEQERDQVEADERLEAEAGAAAADMTETMEDTENPDDHVVSYQFGRLGSTLTSSERVVENAEGEDEELLSQPYSRRYDSSDDEEEPAPLISLVDDDEPTDTFVHEPPPASVIASYGLTMSVQGSRGVNVTSGIAELEPLEDIEDDREGGVQGGLTLSGLETMDTEEINVDLPEVGSGEQEEIDDENFPSFQQFPCLEEFSCPPTPGGALLFSRSAGDASQKEPRPSSSAHVPSDEYDSE